jgi:hypothetical protein
LFDSRQHRQLLFHTRVLERRLAFIAIGKHPNLQAQSMNTIIVEVY